MKKTAQSHSFRRLLDAPGGVYQQYVLSADRYRGLVEFLGARFTATDAVRALDIGCGGGVISRGLAERFGHVTGVDQNADNIVLAKSLTDESGYDNVSFEAGNAMALSAEDASMDLTLLNGVLEWAGQNQAGEHPAVRQLQALRECARVLRPGGWLYLAIENRWHPRALLRDPHTQVPLVSALPRWLAEPVNRAMTGQPYQSWIYGCRQLRRLVRQAGFGQVDMFVPYPGYHRPVGYIPLRSRREALEAIAQVDMQQVEQVLGRSQRRHDVRRSHARMRRQASWGLLGLLANGFAFLCRKT